MKELEKQSVALTPFGQMMRARLGGGHLINISKDPYDRIVRLTFRIDDDTGNNFSQACRSTNRQNREPFSSR